MHRFHYRVLATIGTEYKHTASVTHESHECQFSNAESYEYFIEPQNLSFFCALCELSHQIATSPTLYRSYSACTIDNLLIFVIIISLCLNFFTGVVPLYVFKYYNCLMTEILN